jgi:Family of unknown function (DUF5670)
MSPKSRWLWTEPKNPMRRPRKGKNREGDEVMLYTSVGLLLMLWLLGLGMHIGGNVIHVLLVIAVVVFLLIYSVVVDPWFGLSLSHNREGPADYLGQ